jgi:hypothetical protein
VTDEELRRRLHDSEDGWTERKQKGGTEEIEGALSAFANSLPDGTNAILFLGVSNSGDFVGVIDADKLQKRVKQIADHCYPPIPYTCRCFKESGKEIVAVIVSPSQNGPHFTGPAFVRIGSETYKASPEQFEKLIARRTSKGRKLIDAMESHQPVLISITDRRLGISGVPMEYFVTHCDVHSATFKPVDVGVPFSEPLERITIARNPYTGGLFLHVES